MSDGRLIVPTRSPEGLMGDAPNDVLDADQRALIELPASAMPLVTASWDDDIEPLYRALYTASLTARYGDAWLSSWSQVEELLEEAQSLAFIAYAADTRHADSEAAYLRFMTEVVPRQAEWRVRLTTRALDAGLGSGELREPFRRLQADASIFRPENRARQSELRSLESRYHKIMGARTVDWDERRLTLPALQRCLESTDRATRERAFRAEAHACLEVRNELNAILDRMVTLRGEVARVAGFASYRDYAFVERHRFDYGPRECERFHAAVEEVVVPALARVYQARKRRLGVSTLRPWDVRAEPDGSPTPAPFEDVGRLVDCARNIFERTDGKLGAWFRSIEGQHLFDLETREGKAPGAYCLSLAARRMPFLFMSAVGTQSDVTTLAHEVGHGCHEIAARGHRFFWQRQPCIEAAEFAAMSLELLAAPHYTAPDAFYTPDEGTLAWRLQLEEILFKLVHIASVDAFQHWLYTSPHGGDADARDEAWLAVRARFEPEVDWTGLRRERTVRWYRQLHIFTQPFYYIEYGLAQVAALQLWDANATSPRVAIGRYKRALALGGSASLPEIYRAAGVALAFDAASLAPVVARVESAIEQLE